MNNLEERKKFAFKYRGEVFVVIEKELKINLPGIRTKKGGINYILLNANLPERKKQLEFHRLLTGKGLRNVNTGKKVNFKNSSFTDKVKEDKHITPVKEKLLDDYSEDQVKMARQQLITHNDFMKLIPIFKGIKKECDNDELFTLAYVYSLGIANGKHEERDRRKRKKISFINSEFNKIEGLSL